MARLTWKGEGLWPAPQLEWRGVTFPLGQPVEVDDPVTIKKASANPAFKVEDDPKPPPPAPDPESGPDDDGEDDDDEDEEEEEDKPATRRAAPRAAPKHAPAKAGAKAKWPTRRHR